MSKALAAGVVVVVAVAAVLGAYLVTRGGGPNARMGYLTVAAQDPGPIAGVVYVYVEATEIDVHNVNGSWITVLSQPAQVKLNYVLNTTGVFTTAKVPAGSYDMVRIIVPQDGVKVAVNTSIQPLPGVSVSGLVNVTASVPSGAQTGIKIYTNFTIQPGATYTLILHFHLVETGSGKFLLTPQTHAQTATTAAEFVSELYMAHLNDAASGNTSALSAEYAGQATASWLINLPGAVSINQSASDGSIPQMWASILGKLNVSAYTVAVQSVNVTANTAQAEGYITLTITLHGKTYELKLLDRAVYTFNGQVWLITSEQVSQTT